MFKNKSFAERLAATKSIFSKALDDARSLSEEMRLEEIRLKEELTQVEATKAETDSFINNLAKLV